MGDNGEDWSTDSQRDDRGILEKFSPALRELHAHAVSISGGGITKHFTCPPLDPAQAKKGQDFMQDALVKAGLSTMEFELPLGATEDGKVTLLRPNILIKEPVGFRQQMEVDSRVHEIISKIGRNEHATPSAPSEPRVEMPSYKTQFDGPPEHFKEHLKKLNLHPRSTSGICVPKKFEGFAQKIENQPLNGHKLR